MRNLLAVIRREARFLKRDGPIAYVAILYHAARFKRAVRDLETDHL